MPKLVAMVRVKDGILFVREWLNVMGKLADEIVVVDNGSTDGTLEILQLHPKVVEIKQTQGFHQGRDQILTYEMARKRKPDWCIWLDIDEIFESRLTRETLEKMMSTEKYTQYVFRRYDFLFDYQHYLLYYKEFEHCFGFSRILWKEQSTGFFQNILIHCGCIQGISGKVKRSKYRIKHYGYVDKQYVERKTNLYINVDPGRKEMYLKHFAKTPGKMLRWYEYDENPGIVNIQSFFYGSVYYSSRLLNKLLKLLKIK